MATKLEGIKQGIKTDEKLIALNILLVIYLHDKRYAEAMEDIEELLNDPEMQVYREYLFLRQEEVKMASESFIKRRHGLIEGLKSICKRLLQDSKAILSVNV